VERHPDPPDNGDTVQCRIIKRQLQRHNWQAAEAAATMQHVFSTIAGGNFDIYD